MVGTGIRGVSVGKGCVITRRWGDGGDLLGVWGVEKYWEKFGDGNEGFFVFGALILKSVYKKTTH